MSCFPQMGDLADSRAAGEAEKRIEAGWTRLKEYEKIDASLIGHRSAGNYFLGRLNARCLFEGPRFGGGV
jgi:hypothetical protein